MIESASSWLDSLLPDRRACESLRCRAWSVPSIAALTEVTSEGLRDRSLCSCLFAAPCKACIADVDDDGAIGFAELSTSDDAVLMCLADDAGVA